MESAPNSKALAKIDYEKHVSAAFRKLVKRGFHPNLAAAYAVMLVSTGVVSSFRSVITTACFADCTYFTSTALLLVHSGVA